MIDFSKVSIQGIEREEFIDVRKPIGNYLYYNSRDLEGSTLGHDIYYSEGVMELTEKQKNIIKSCIHEAIPSYVIARAVELILTQENYNED